MRKFLLPAILTVLFAAAPALAARGKVQGFVEKGGQRVTVNGSQSETRVQRSYPGDSVTVYKSGTLTKATLYATEGGAAKANPFSADARGAYSFWTDEALVDISFSTAAYTLGNIGTTSGSTLSWTMVNRLGTGSGTVIDPWVGWEAGMNALPNGSTVHFPAGQYSQVTKVILKKNSVYTGDGKKISVITSAFTGTAFQTYGTINVIAEDNIDVRDIGIVNTNALNVGSGILEVFGSMFKVERVEVQGFKFGITLLGSEVVTLEKCDIFNALKAGIWIVGDGSYNLTHADIDFSAGTSGYTNVIHIKNCQISGNPQGIIDDGGSAHTITQNIFNGGTNAILMHGTINATISENYVESVSGTAFKMQGVGGVSGNVIGGSTGITFAGNQTAVAAGQRCVELIAASPVTFVRNQFNTNVVAVTGVALQTHITNLGSINFTGAGTFDFPPQLDGYLQLTFSSLAQRDSVHQNFVLKIINNGGTIQHKIVSNVAEGSTNFASKIVGATTVDTSTPQVAAGVAFAGGVGVNAATTNQVLFDTSAAQLAVDTIGSASVVLTNIGIAAPTVDLVTNNINVNGTTQVRTALAFYNPTTGANYPITTASLAPGQYLYVRVECWLK